IDTPALRKRYNVPDDWQKPSVELERLVPSFQKGSGARRMGRCLGDARSNRSRSYQVFLEGVMRLATEMGWRPSLSNEFPTTVNRSNSLIAGRHCRQVWRSGPASRCSARACRMGHIYPELSLVCFGGSLD
ncbi:hypothetical protein ACG3RN_09670, partial [Pseudomonas aeruginosa]